VRSRLIVVPAALIVVAYLKGRRDGRLEQSPAPAESPVPDSPLLDQDRIARALAADAVELAEAQAAAAGSALLVPTGPRPVAEPDDEWEDFATTPDAVLASEWVAAPAPVAAPSAPRREDAPVAVLEARPEPEPVVEVRVDETGRFSLGGYATQAGHIALAGITFRERRSGIVAPDSVALVTEAANNVAPGGLVVLADSGLAPDASGITIVAAAEGQATYAAAGYYELAGA
jgi:hypothetical protein